MFNTYILQHPQPDNYTSHNSILIKEFIRKNYSDLTDDDLSRLSTDFHNSYKRHQNQVNKNPTYNVRDLHAKVNYLFNVAIQDILQENQRKVPLNFGTYNE